MNKLLWLRKELNDLDGFVIPITDKFRQTNSGRLEWLTGFTGSAGTAVVLKDLAAFFTDGRYTLQARKEVKSYEHYNISKKTPYKWLEVNALTDYRIGFDPWSFTENELLDYTNSAKTSGFKMVATENLIDRMRKNTSLPQSQKIFLYDTKYAGMSSIDKRMSICQDMMGNYIEAAVITSPESISWLLNIRGRDLPFTPSVLSFAILHFSGNIELYIDERKVAGEITLGDSVSIHPMEEITEGLENLNEERVLVDPSTAPSEIFSLLKKAKADIVHGDDLCTLPKACKNDTEIAGTRSAHIKDGVAVCKYLSWLYNTTEKISEISAACKLRNFREENDLFFSPSFETISAYGSNGAIVHYHADDVSNKLIGKDSLYLVDSGGQYLDGTTDITRTISLGKPTEEQKKHFTLVLKGHIALADAKFPRGTKGSELDILARYPLWQEGLDYDHGTGHGVGSFLNVHEGPHGISKKSSKVPLEPRMVISNEPGIYLEGKYGIRIENLVVVMKYGDFLGFETLTMVPIDTVLIEKKLLTKHEKDWINTYHQKVYRLIYPRVDKQTAKWLTKKTKLI